MANLFDVNWLEDYKAKQRAHGGKPLPKKSRPSTRMKAEDLTRQNESPHWKALNYLAKHPDDIKRKGEHYSQVRIFWHFEQHDTEIYKRLHATPNGGYRTDATGAAMKAEGQKKGYPDMSLDMVRGMYYGLRLELKHGKNSLSDEQIGWLRQLDEDGYYCVVCYSDKEAIDAITAYAALVDCAEMPPHIHDHLWKKQAA